MPGRQYRQVAYGLTQALIPENPAPIIAKRNPLASDFAFPTTLWTNITTSTVWVLASVANNAANWVQIQAGGGGGAGIFTSLTVTPGPISLTGTTTINTAGAAATTIGTGGTGVVNIGNATGNTAVTGALGATTTITAGTGLIATTGGITATGVSAIQGNTSINTAGAGTTDIGVGGTGAVAIGNATGNTTIPAGNLTLTLGNVVVSAGDLTLTLGNFIATTGDLRLGNAASGVQFTAAAGVKILAGAGDPNGALNAAKGSMFLRNDGADADTTLYVNTSIGVGTAWVALTST